MDTMKMRKVIQETKKTMKALWALSPTSNRICLHVTMKQIRSSSTVGEIQ
jgi:hypothetical protein